MEKPPNLLSASSSTDNIKALKSDDTLRSYIAARTSTNNDSTSSSSLVSQQQRILKKTKTSCHMGVPLDSLERHEPISCHATGKRNSCAPDDQIRIYVKFPMSGDRK